VLHRVVRVQSNEPPKEHVVLKLLHQHPLAPHAVEQLQEQRSQQVFRRRRAAVLRLGPTEPRREIAQDRIDQGPQACSQSRHDLSDCFDDNQTPIAFRTIQSSLRASDFMQMPPDHRVPDSDGL